MRRATPWLVLASTLLADLARAQPVQRRLSLVDDARTTMGVAWTTPDLVDSVVRYGLTSAYGQQVTGAPPVLTEGIGYVHEVTLRELSPGTRYHYSVGDGVTFSEDATFDTAPDDPCGAWSFVAMGDDRTQFGFGDHPGVATQFPEILLEAAATGPALILNTGDLVMEGSDEEQWVDYLSSTEPVAAVIPLLPVIGNHDTDAVEGAGAAYNRIFHLPRGGTGTEDAYAVRYRNAIFAVLSTHTFEGGLPGDPRPFALQAAWLDEVLAAHADATWRIVAIHSPAFTGGGGGISHPPNESGANEVLLPVLDAHHVDLVLSGHNHWYERFHPLVQGSDLTRGERNVDGTVHITTGGAGAYTMELGSFSPCFGDVDGTRATCSGRHHFVTFALHDRALRMETWATRCQNFGCSDSNVELLDTLAIDKPGPSSCTPPLDAGVHDAAAGIDAAGPRDAAVAADARVVPDATTLADARSVDRGASVDVAAAPVDAGAGSTPDAGGGEAPVSPGGCGCTTASATTWPGLALALLVGSARRRRRRGPG